MTSSTSAPGLRTAQEPRPHPAGRGDGDPDFAGAGGRRADRAAPRRGSRAPLLLLLLALLPFVAACGSYTIQGRVVRTGYSGVVVTEASDARLSGTGIAGVSISIVRDPGRLNTEQVGSTVTDADGNFTLVVSALGAGITDEEWLLRAGRRGVSPVESMIRLPASPGQRRILVMTSMGAGDPSSYQAPEPVQSIGDSIQAEVNRFW
ncbi:MAG TPA: hypothetical protein PKC43_01745 [Phycisphaerales bacterium]|nr:hypothetical protein [Phycisphaerales bacterium]HMP36148.1 hypothetical protein [Phycisphaerales bacterium]